MFPLELGESSASDKELQQELDFAMKDSTFLGISHSSYILLPVSLLSSLKVLVFKNSKELCTVWIILWSMKNLTFPQGKSVY